MKTTGALLAVILVIIVIATEAGYSRRSRRLKLVPIGGRRQRPIRPKLRRIVFIRENTKNNKRTGKPALSEIDGLRSDKRTRGIRKSEHYINPELLAKLNQVKDMKDFVRIFKPKGFTLRREIRFKARSGSAKDRLTAPKAVVDTKVYYQGRQYTAQDATGSFACIPRLVPQSLETLGKVTYPRCTFVKRCGGCCPAARECVADRTTTKLVNVFEIFRFGGYKYVQRKLVDHSSCKCDCIVKPSDCTSMQTYVKDNCQCECRRNPQMCPAGKEWSQRLCDCQCKSKQFCGARRQWDEKNCKCACTKQPCPGNQVRNPENCRCNLFAGEAMEPFRREFQRGFDDADTDDSSPDDLWGDF